MVFITLSGQNETSISNYMYIVCNNAPWGIILDMRKLPLSTRASRCRYHATWTRFLCSIARPISSLKRWGCRERTRRPAEHQQCLEIRVEEELDFKRKLLFSPLTPCPEPDSKYNALLPQPSDLGICSISCLSSESEPTEVKRSLIASVECSR